MTPLPRRALLLGLAASISGCATIGALEDASRALPTFELAPLAGGPGTRRAITLAVASPQAPAAITTDRILVKPDPLMVTYLPDARWSEEVPQMLQSLVVRSIAGTGRLGHVGTADGGPVPDVALLLRIDAFQVEPIAEQQTLPVRIALSVSLIRDRDQRLLASRDFEGTAIAASDDASAIVAAFQDAIDGPLGDMADWAAGNV